MAAVASESGWMMVGRQDREKLSQSVVDDIRESAAWARSEAGKHPLDTAGWIKAMATAHQFDLYAEELQARLDAVRPA